MKKGVQIKKWVDIVLRWLIIGAFVLFIVLIVVGFLIFEIFDKPMSSHIQSLKKFLMAVGGITVLCLAYIGVRNLLLSVGLIKGKPYWLPRQEEYFDYPRKDWVWFLFGLGAMTLLAAILAWFSR